MTANVNTYSPRDGDVRWRIPQWPAIMATLAAERGANLLLVGEGGRVVFGGAAADVLRYLATAEYGNRIAMFERERAAWLSYNDDAARMPQGPERRRFEREHGVPRVADAPDYYVTVDGQSRGPYKRGFPFEAELNALRAGSPTTPASVASAAVTWGWVRLP